jgi:hypothetical protein
MNITNNTGCDKIDWDLEAPGFCESLVSGPPEYVGAFTSLFMTLFGSMGLFLSRNTNILGRVIAASLTFTGIGSLGYHWSLYAGWGMLDSIPMLISSWLGGYFAFDAILYKEVAIKKNLRRDYELYSSLLSLPFITALVVSIVFSVTDNVPNQLFTITFLVSELLIAVSVILIRFLSHHELAGNEEFHQAFTYMYAGVGTAVSAAIIWAIVENMCILPGNEWMRYTYAHGFWHFGISLGMYYLIQFFIFVHAHNIGNEPYFIKRNGFQGVLFKIFPAVEFHGQKSLLVKYSKKRYIDDLA